MERHMRLQLIRNATLRLNYAGQTILIDPSLAEKHSQASLAGKSPNPTVALPMPADEVTRGIDLVLVSHLHADHIDLKPPRIPTGLPVLGQPNDTDALRGAGFTTVTGLEGGYEWKGIQIIRTGGEHGTGPVGQAMGQVSGFVLRAPGEPTVYIAGDTIWNDEVQMVLEIHQPAVIVTNSGGGQIQGTVILMDTQETLAVAAAAPEATIIAVHLEAYDHMMVTRQELRNAVRQAGLESRVLIPDDGEVIDLT